MTAEDIIKDAIDDLYCFTHSLVLVNPAEYEDFNPILKNDDSIVVYAHPFIEKGQAIAIMDKGLKKAIFEQIKNVRDR